MVGHAIRLCDRDIDDLLNTKVFESYEQVYSPQIEQDVFSNYGDAIDKLWELYLRLCEDQFTDNLPDTKFFRLVNFCKYIGKKILKKIDI